MNCERTFKHSYQSENTEYFKNAANPANRLGESDHLIEFSSNENSQEDDYQIFEIIEIPDDVSEIAIKAKSYSDAQNLAKKFGFKNLGRVPNLPNTYNLVRDISRNKKRKISGLNESDYHNQPKPVFFNNKHKIYFLEDQKPLKRVKRDFLIHKPIDFNSKNQFNRRAFQKKQVLNTLPITAQTVPTIAGQPGRFSQRNFFIPMNYFPQSNEAMGAFKFPTPQQAPFFKNNFNDELFKDQWYLNQEYPDSRNSLRVREAWEMGYTGKGVVVTVIDDGLETNHTDLMENYDSSASIDINGRDSDPTPNYFDDNAHGTRCAGEIAMKASNKKCGVGIAFNCKIGGIRLLDGNVIDLKEAQAFLHNYHHVDIYSSSWGPNDDGETVDGPKPLAREALQRGCEHGRKGLGSIYVWASGNGGKKGDNCNCDGYVGSIYTIAFGSVGQNGNFPWYGERCSAMHAVTYSSNSGKEKKVATTDIKNQCTTDHSGTSAAAPIAAGIIALVLEANPNLTWRDVQHLITWTSDFSPMKNSPGWRQNAVGLLFNDRFGFGMLNAVEIINKAKNWHRVPKMNSCAFKSRGNEEKNNPIYIDEVSPSVVFFDSDSCRNTQNEINFVEQVQVKVNVKLPERGHLEMFLVSPSGTGSVLLTKRPNDASASGFNRWNFTSVHFWGESAYGTWKLFFKIQRGGYGGEVNFARLFIHGTAEKPNHMYEQPIRVYPEFNGDIKKVLDFTMPFDNELKNVLPQEDLHKDILKFSDIIVNGNKMNTEQDNFDSFGNPNFFFGNRKN